MADPVVVVETKKPYESKTLLVNALIAIAGALASLGILPSVNDFLQGHADVVVMAVGILGVVLRLVTKGKISIE
jgi:hypothetical protein